MKKFSNIDPVNVGVSTLSTELVYLTENNQQVGSLLLVYEEGKASVFSLEVLSTHRKKGYGKRLMESAIKRCQERGIPMVELNTDIENKTANNLYTSMGFELKGLKDGFNNYIKNI